jgi:hypothetical protein
MKTRRIPDLSSHVSRVPFVDKSARVLYGEPKTIRKGPPPVLSHYIISAIPPVYTFPYVDFAAGMDNTIKLLINIRWINYRI